MIMINSKEVIWKKDETISLLLKRMNFVFPMIVVKINGRLIKKDKYSTQLINDNDEISVIHMISGG
ncbi:sulfur carrier protein ThiS [bacterium]|nr:sulfur carrier protein ThiS [bacterium]